jgi:hypothetical protein
MRAMTGQNTDPAAFVAKRDQILAEDANCERQIGKLRREADRLPKSAHQLAHWRIRVGPGQLSVRRRDVAEVIARIRLLPYFHIPSLPAAEFRLRRLLGSGDRPRRRENYHPPGEISTGFAVG